MRTPRKLVVVADDFGIGPETDRAILELASEGLVPSTVLMVNSPHAEAAIRSWNRAGRPLELGWHPVLTCDSPVLPAERVPSLVEENGRFHPLGRFMRRSLLGKLNCGEVLAELAAQYDRFLDLAGAPPALVNSHQHTSLFRPVSAALHELLKSKRERPFVRRVREPRSMIARIPGARIKRGVLSFLGKGQAQELERDGFPGCDWLAGINDPKFIHDPAFLARWLTRVPGRSVELACHPGYYDRSLIGRDGTETNGLLDRRVWELERYRDPELRSVIARAGFEIVPASRLNQKPLRLAA
jgi:predicted glycoside hydrolase/deacetylase ChbG (UPF0249 family)